MSNNVDLNGSNTSAEVIEETFHSLLTKTTYHARPAILKRAKQQSHQTPSQTLARWRNEVDILRRVTDHRYITQIFGADESDMSIVMRYEGGLSLDKLVDAEQYSMLSKGECKVLLKGMVSALAHLHGLGIVHDDVKPDNIMWTPSTHNSINHSVSESGRPVLIDFGAAFDQNSLGPGYFVPNGTPSWTPPEFLERRKGREGDIWGLGVVMVWALGLCGLPDGEWILPWALEGRTKDREEMERWLGEVEELRERLEVEGIGDVDGEEGWDWGVVAKMLVAKPEGRTSSEQLVLAVDDM